MIPWYKWYTTYRLKLLPWAREVAVPGGSSFVTGRPFRTEELTQPLGLLWISPESWFMPLSPLTAGDIVKPLLLLTESPRENVALSAAAYSGWLSLQGPGFYRATSELFTLVVESGPKRFRTTIRPFRDARPRIIAVVEEES